ncbi:uncharacterized protein LOC118347669 [Juglans regia]|uniref:Uncharacterized protein LOC118347669 n=1 Tax=Juglans regia TaxID=51240 RepID=A0A6P9E8D7_JUGRE|nr:uncharacterized protein LOC118347669 [Juglans regia]
METPHDRDLWSDGFEDVLVDLLYEDTLMDRLRGGRITTADNVRLAERLSAIGPNKFNCDQVKGKIALLKRRQREFTDLMKQTGLGWDQERKAPVASEEYWANAISVRSSWKHYKTHGCPKYEQLCAIFGCSVATGTMGRASTDPAPDSDDERLLEEDMLTCGQPVTDQEHPPSPSGVPLHSSTPFSASYASGSRRRQRTLLTFQNAALQQQMIIVCVPACVESLLLRSTQAAALMDHDSSFAETPSIGTNSEMDDSCSSMTHNSEADQFMLTYPSSGDEAAMQEKCLGALDDTMISAAAPARLSNAYRNRYNRIAQKVLCLCEFVMKFTFVYTGWEGTAHDARVFPDALSRARNGFPCPDPRYYYLVDSAFPCIEKFMTPYPRERQRMIVTACCTLHNLIKTVTPNDEFIQHALGLQLNGESMPGGEDVSSTEEVADMSHESARAMAAQRDGIMIPLWENWNGG